MGAARAAPMSPHQEVAAQMDDPFQLSRFVNAQNPVFPRVLGELRAGRKTSHWMWFVFPQIAGLGFSSMSQRFAITSPDEARAFLDHPVLGPRLRDCIAILLGINGRSAHQIFGSPDDAKLRSCLTLFARAAPEEDIFAQALEKYYAGQPDPETLARLGVL